MPDISMCSNGHQCPKKDMCWRYTAPPSAFWQAYSGFYKVGEECDHYWDRIQEKMNETN